MEFEVNREDLIKALGAAEKATASDTSGNTSSQRSS